MVQRLDPVFGGEPTDPGMATFGNADLHRLRDEEALACSAKEPG